MKIKAVVILTLAGLTLTGCSVQEVAEKASDAAACTALSSTMNTVVEGYNAGLVDSGVIKQATELLAGMGSLLSEGLRQDLEQLAEVLANTDGAQAAKNQVSELADSIQTRCENVGVTIGQ
jgi:hypothetical protein